MYNRTQNDNGTYNTRCLDCLLTVATSVETAEDLERLEAHHMCPERALSELLAEEIRDRGSRHTGIKQGHYLLVGSRRGALATSGGWAWPPEIFL